jgi:tail protein
MTVLADDLTWQLGDSGVLLNDTVTFGTPFVDIERIVGLDSAPARQSKKDHEGVDGGFMDAEFETGRDITLSGTVYSNGQPLQPYLDQLKANWAVGTVLVPLYMRNDEVGQRMVWIKPFGCQYDVDTSIRLGMTAIMFQGYAEDPRIYDDNLIDVTMGVGATVYTGFSLPFGFPFGFGGVSSTTDGQLFYNNGNRSSPVVFTMTGPLTNPYILNDTTDNVLQFNATLNTGETLVVDTGYRTVRFAGTTNRRSWLQNPGWFQMQPSPPNGIGPNLIRFRAQGGTGTLRVQYRQAWR